MLLSPSIDPSIAFEQLLEKLGAIALQIHQCSTLAEVLNCGVRETRELFGGDRTLVFQFLANRDGVVIAESVASGWRPIVGQLIYDPCFDRQWADAYLQGRVGHIADVAQSGLAPCHIDLLTQMQVQANLVAPIVVYPGGRSPADAEPCLWGLLIVHQCSAPRHWQPIHLQAIKQIALQMGIALQHLEVQQRLEQSQWDGARCRAALEGAEDGVWDWNNETNEVFFSHHWKAMLGYEDDEIGTGLDEWDSRIHPDDREATYAELEKHFSGQTPIYRSEHRVRAKDGTWKWILDRGKVIEWKADGTPLRMVGTRVDITQRKQLEASLQESQQKYQTLFHVLPIGVSITDANGQLIETNPTSEEILGASTQEVLQRGLADGSWQTVHPDGSLMAAAEHPAVRALREKRMVRNAAMGVVQPNGRVLWLSVSAAPIPLKKYGVAIAYIDITSLKQAEQRLQLQSTALEACADVIVIADRHGTIEWVNPAFVTLTGYLPEEAIGKNPRDLVKSGLQDSGFYRQLWQQVLSGRVWRGELINRRKDGSLYHESMTITPVYSCQNRVSHFIAVKQDITERKRLEAAVSHEVQRERMIHFIKQHIRESLDLLEILQTTVQEVRRFLKTDRVIIYRLNPDWSGVVVVESVATGWMTIRDQEITDSCFVETQGSAFHNNRVYAVADVRAASFSECYRQLLEWMQVRAKLVVPIFRSGMAQENQLWGLLIAHQCRGPRPWESSETKLLQQLSEQLAIAIQQSELYEQVQTLNGNLERQVEIRTAELQQSLHFESLLKRITDKVRDSLDEAQILQTVVEELATGLALGSCNTGIYSHEQTVSTVAYEATHTLASVQGLTFAIADAFNYDIYPQLFQGQVCQFCDALPNSVRPDRRLFTILACPIWDDQGILGDLWLFKPRGDVFNDLEVRLVRQVANQCAIALRQSRLYQAAQEQVRELERLNQLKDDFLSTISHELRTPIASIKLATQMLEMSLQRLGVLDDPSSSISQYFSILKKEGQREISLIDDLLDLTRIDTEMEPINLTAVDLQSLMPHIAEPFVERTRQHQQGFDLTIPNDLPIITTDLTYLERCVTELLDNACKYTPPGERIALSVQADKTLALSVSNSGIEISEEERDRIFDKFYRIPNHDPWKYSGTGLGLALVKKMVRCLGGTLTVASGPEQGTTFTIHLAL